MAKRVQVILDEEEREAFRRLALREGLSLSAWLRNAGLDRLAAATGRRLLASEDELQRFFLACDAREEGTEPDWQAHAAVIDRSIRSDGSET